MSGSVIDQGSGPGTVYAPVPTQAIWTWSTSGLPNTPPVVIGYPPGGSGQPTKSGVMPTDLQQFVGVPLQLYNLNPPLALTQQQIIQFIRYAEDEIERETSVRLCQTWISAPPAWTPLQTQAINLQVSGAFQQLGVDYDLYEPGYDFVFNRAQDEGWMHLKTRWRPIKLANPGGFNNGALGGNTAIRNFSYVYPLLNDYFRAPSTWLVEDQNFGILRLVPSTNVAMLPLFAMQLAFMGFAESVPGGICLQYVCGLTANDYNSEFSFMKQLVLAKAACIALAAIQGTVNIGAIETSTNVDGLAYRIKYSEKGAFSGLMAAFATQVKDLMKVAKSKVQGPVFGVV